MYPDFRRFFISHDQQLPYSFNFKFFFCKWQPSYTVFYSPALQQVTTGRLPSAHLVTLWSDCFHAALSLSPGNVGSRFSHRSLSHFCPLCPLTKIMQPKIIFKMSNFKTLRKVIQILVLNQWFRVWIKLAKKSHVISANEASLLLEISMIHH